MTPKEFDILRNTGKPYLLLDVRTEEELALARVDPCVHIPLHELEARVEELRHAGEGPIVCLCHHGIRSAAATNFLRAAGFSEVHNLCGGIDAFASDIDPKIGYY